MYRRWPWLLWGLYGGTMTTGGPHVPSGGDTMPGPTSGRHHRAYLGQEGQQAQALADRVREPARLRGL